MTSQFQVDTAQIASGATEIQRISGEIESDVTLMMSRLTALQDAWKGSASTGFHHAVTSWSATQRQVRAALDQIQIALAQAARQYSEVEAANASLFRS